MCSLFLHPVLSCHFTVFFLVSFLHVISCSHSQLFTLYLIGWDCMRQGTWFLSKFMRPRFISYISSPHIFLQISFVFKAEILFSFGCVPHYHQLISWWASRPGPFPSVANSVAINVDGKTLCGRMNSFHICLGMILLSHRVGLLLISLRILHMTVSVCIPTSSK